MTKIANYPKYCIFRIKQQLIKEKKIIACGKEVITFHLIFPA